MSNMFDDIAFSPADILLPKDVDMSKWAVVACDQFTSEPEYWEAVRAQAEGKPSAYHIIFPEAEFGNETQNAKRIVEIQQTMYDYANADFFRRYPDAMIYVERTLTDGSIPETSAAAIRTATTVSPDALRT